MKKKYLNINLIKLLSTLSISFLILQQVNAGKIKEAVLLDDLNSAELKNKHTRRYSKWAKELNEDGSADVFSFQDQNTFERLFPSHPLDSGNYDDKSFYVGQIAGVLGSNGVGTGTLLEAKAVTPVSVRAIGITAMHNFVGTKDGEVYISGRFTKQFFLGAKSVGSDSIDNYGTMKIDRVSVQDVPSKDICLFEGVITPNRKYFWARDGVERPEDAKPEDVITDFVSSFNAKKPSVVNSELAVDTGVYTMYHYPLGKRNQRVNKGHVFHDGRHQIRSLFGSSGASIFNSELEVVGVHRGFDLTALKDKVVEIPGGELPVVEYNSFVKTSIDEYNGIVSNGINLYGGGLTEEFMASLSQFAAENLTDYEY